MKPIVLIVIFGSLNCLTAFLVGESVTRSEMSHILEQIGVFSAVTLAIVGIWIAVLFPGLLGDLFSGNEDLSKDFVTAGRLLNSLLLVSMVSIVALGAQFLQILIDPVPPIFIRHVDHIKQVGLFLVLSLAELAIYALLLAIAPGYQLVFDRRQQARVAERRKKRFKEK